MERNLYVEALLRDPVLAVMVKEALNDGLIDRAAALLACWSIALLIQSQYVVRE